jgi:hypothetical protein
MKETKFMIVAEPTSGSITIRVASGRDEINEIVVQKTNSPLRLENRNYQRYQIVKPKGYEDQEIIYCLDRGLEELLSAVFIALASPIKRLPGCDMRA